MVKVRYATEPRRARYIRLLNSALKGRLFKVAIFVFLVGISMVISSFQIQGIYYYQNNTTSKALVGSGQNNSVEFSMLSGSPFNISFTGIPNGAVVHYTAYTVAQVEENGLPVVIKNFAFSGNATENTVVHIGSYSSSQNFQMVLSSDYISPFNVTVLAQQNIPRNIPSNYYLGFPGAFVVVVGAIALAVSITKARSN